ncbi:MAG TPA: DNA translocase FtsK 4TM domain-containing protein [Lentimicrobium sp.]|nr:DNA translocase FtsK 4TM domain-containing protein [Lentimicrobium sp.]
MAAKGNTLKKNRPNKDPEEKPQKQKKGKTKLPAWMTDGRIGKIAGVFFILLSIYLLFAFSSYLFLYFKWDADDIFSHFSFNEILFDDSIEADNWAGRLGAAISILFIKKGFGIASYFFILILFVAGIKLSLRVTILPLWKTIINSLAGIIWFTVALGFIFRNSALAILGGVTGYQSAYWLEGLLGKTGTMILLFFTLVSFLVFAFNMPLAIPKPPKPDEDGVDGDNNDELLIAAEIERQHNIRLSNGIPEDRYNTVEFAVKDEHEEQVDFTAVNQNEIIEDSILTENQNTEIEFTIEDNTLPENNESTEETGEEDEGVKHYTIDTEYDPTLELPDYRKPTLDLLDDYTPPSISFAAQKEELEANKDRIVETLGNYGIVIDKIKATIGPTVTLYEIIPAKGVRISKIRNLEDDIALSLAAMGIRIIAPIPGKGTIGIEVPNLKPETVPIKSILGSEKFTSSKYDLPFGIGKTIQNEPYIVDLAKLPHILMAGATGQGKSVGLNAIITSLLYCKHPSEVKFIMIDPKKVELTLFSKIERHFLAKLPDSEEAIITDTRKVVRTLNSLNIEMENRYDLLKDAQVRNIKEYNIRFLARKLNPMHGHRFLPYLIVVIDEYADLIMTAGKEIEIPLTLLAQKARAIGIHLVIATQRPSVNIITGTIKANFPARIAFRVISKIDSRTILDSGGADQLVGRGDMLLSTGSDLLRLQCAFVDTHEVERVTEFIGSQRAYPDAFHLPEYADEQDEKEVDFDPGQRDELFEEAARIIVATQQGSTSLLQRKLKLGYNRAGRIIDQLEAAGIVGPFEGSKAREVKVANEFALEQFLKDINMNQKQNEF